MRPSYNLDKIKFAADGPTFERAVGLYESGKVTQPEEDYGGYSAVVLGTNFCYFYRNGRAGKKFTLKDYLSTFKT